MTMDGKWTIDFNFSVFPPIIIATLLHCYIATLQHCCIASLLHSLTSSSRLSALEEGSAVDYSYNNYEHAAAAASTRNTDVVSYGTWKQSAERGKTTWTENSKYCHFLPHFLRGIQVRTKICLNPEKLFLKCLETFDWTNPPPIPVLLYWFGFLSDWKT